VKIIPYSVLAATLLSGMVAAPGSAFTAGSRGDVSRAVDSETADPQAQEENKAKQTAGSPERVAPAQSLGALPTGTTIYAELEKAVDVRKAKPGDKIAARSTLPVLWQGKIVIPNESKIVGHVTEVVQRVGEDGHSRLGILFDGVMMKDGSRAPISLTVQALGARSFTARADDPGQPHSYAGQHAISNNGARLANSNPTGPTMERPQIPDTPETSHTLDAGSYGTIGLSDLNLYTPKDTTRGSMVVSAKRNVKLDGQTEIVLRVVVEPADDAEKADAPGKP
jgi:hypothetical protein